MEKAKRTCMVLALIATVFAGALYAQSLSAQLSIFTEGTGLPMKVVGASLVIGVTKIPMSEDGMVDEEKLKDALFIAVNLTLIGMSDAKIDALVERMFKAKGPFHPSMKGKFMKALKAARDKGKEKGKGK